MSENDNTVNMKNREGRYHHGDLRSALVEEGLAQLDTKAPEAVSLREIARNVGVSATAVYRHFPDKDALLAALCDVGGRRLSEHFHAATAGISNPQDAFNEMGRAYVRFALANPSLFRLMMSKNPPDPDDAAGAAAGVNPFAMMSGLLKDLLPPDAPSGLRFAKRIQAWALVHGLALLMLDGLVPADEALIDQVVSTSFL